MSETWIEVDEAQDVAASIRHALRSAQFVGEDPYAWKWVVLALHSALQGACVCHLTETASPLGAVKKKNRREWLEYYKLSRSDPTATEPKTHLMTLPELLKECRKLGSAGGPCGSTAIQISDSELEWLTRFHRHIRNQFTHFEPQTWILEVSGIPSIAKLISRIISDIYISGWAFRNFNENEANEFDVNIRKLSDILLR
ncbi:hypothetical protein [Pannonibacter tanglangensis]|uniref:AbiV family abortive infection protein n=1 Tax=Pannonibacter tanglangensis TaxID=2750084 RepID=A0ABW9ZCM3_9HYPH|nr:hypothetical protein [Pannonibacter sp. XCT-34]NBN62251.1 hypothetical protein [Pannonibacter sp. XCT-34]